MATDDKPMIINNSDERPTSGILTIPTEAKVLTP